MVRKPVRAAEAKAHLSALVTEVAGGHGALALVGIWRELTNEEIEAMVEDIYAQRRVAADRPIASLE